MTAFKPMLASPADLDTLRYPLYASPKLDGIRAIVTDAGLVSRKLLLIPNYHTQALFARPEFRGLDGELILGNPTDDDVYRRTNSAVMSHGSEDGGRVTFYVFDDIGMFDRPYKDRMIRALAAISGTVNRVTRALTMGEVNIRWHEQTLIHNREELDAFEEKCVNEGYEGIMTRDPMAAYKFGRSTAIQQHLLKVKRFEDSEAEIVRVEEEMFNGNEAERDNLGRTKRSTAKAGKIGKGTMGALVVRDLKTGVEFNIGTGFTAADRAAEWKPGVIVKYKSFPVGVKDKPRHPVFLGLRSKIDL